MVIGVKFCGGCKPLYDRVKSYNKIVDACVDVRFEPVKDGISYKYILVMEGCLSACASIDNLCPEKGFIFRRSFDDDAEIIAKIHVLSQEDN